MAKGRGGAKSRAKAKDRPNNAEPGDGAAPEGVQPPAARDVPPARPNGQRLWDMPYSTAAPRMINPELGLHNFVARAGHNAGYDIDLTLLDAPDHRLIRSGVLLAHRVLDGRGEWYLGAPDWVPLLPKERIDPMSHGDLPEELADLIRPFRRRAPLGPVAALRCERREFAVRDDHGTTLALLRDDKVTVRRNGLTTARYREVMLTPVGPGLSEQQDLWLCQVLADAGATPMTKFPRLVSRLGAPANGQTDYPVLAAPDLSARFAIVVSTLLARRLRDLLNADLAVRSGAPGAAAGLSRVARLLQCELEGLAPALDREWLGDLVDDLAWVAEEAEQTDRRHRDRLADANPEALKLRLRGERHLTLLERLVAGVRAPKVVDPDGRTGQEVLDRLLADGVRRAVKAADRLSPDAPAESWEAVRAEVQQLARTVDVTEAVRPGQLDGLRGRLPDLLNLLDDCARSSQRIAATRERVPEVSPEEAFELGRRFEQQLAGAAATRRRFLKHWAKTRKQLDIGG